MTAPVLIAGRPFALGVAYAPSRTVVYRGERRPCARRPIEYADHTYPGGRVVVEFAPTGARRRTKRAVMSGVGWAAWVDRFRAEPIEEKDA